MNNRHDNILDTIGNTPVVRVNNLGPKHANIYVKIESFNPMGSVKDRLAMGVIEAGEQSGELKPGQTIIEATSGNTGIGLAMVCAQKGYPLVITMAENFSIERRRLMRFLGAKVVLTPASEMGSGMVAKARELAEKHGWWQSRQFENPANADVHARTTAVEILRDFSDIKLDYWVSGFGTGGTLNGVARVLKAESPETKIMVCEPDNSQTLGSGIPQPRNADGSHSSTHPNFRPHLMQGWSPDFIPALAEQVTDAEHVDGFLPIDGNFAMQCAKDLAQKEGIFVGTSSGATFAGALALAEKSPPGTNILCMLPDTGERYQSTALFDDVIADMNDEEIDIACSTPGYRFDTQPEETEDLPELPQKEAVKLDAMAITEVETVLANNKHQVVMFSLEWCEFCWSVRKMMTQCGIPFITIDLDSVAYQDNERGGKILDVLKQQNNWDTIPQMYVGDQFIGGATDFFDACKDGGMEPQLKKQGIGFSDEIKLDPYRFLPTWLHPR